MTSSAYPNNRIVAASTFTSEPIERSLAFWFAQFGWSWDIAFAPYNQVFQQLLDPNSDIGNNQAGANLFLIRFEDWLQQSESQTEESLTQSFPTQIVDDFLAGITAAATRSTLPHIVCICPASPEATSIYGTQFDHFAQRIEEATDALANVHLIGWHDVEKQLPIETVHNPQGDKLGRIPYTEEFFTAVAAAVARKLFVIQLKPYKVIVVDCDNTLWGGVVGEDGPQGVTISPAHRHFQRVLVEQFEAGKLLCLCSKNVEADVLAVFEQRADEMPLNLDHLVTWRINWQPKSQNIQELADELQLGLDSFIFIDDNPVECAEVQANCPQVLTIPFPKNEADILPVVQNIWAFDLLSVTAEDRNRTQMYRQNMARNRAQTDAPTLGAFLKSLDLRINCTPMRRDQLPRVSQLTQRTNQFNASTIRRSEADILAFCTEDGADCLTIEVTDRFGDYGLVGIVLYKLEASTLFIDTFLLSCRVLGRGVEHGIIEQMAKIAVDQGVSRINIPTVKTSRNEPVLNFLEQIGREHKKIVGENATYSIPVDVALHCSSLLFQSESDAAIDSAAPSESASLTDEATQARAAKVDEPSAEQPIPALLARIATQLQSVSAIQAAIESQVRPRPQVDEPYVSPQSDLEKSIAVIWARALGIDKVGVNDKFTDLGGGSLQIVQIHGQLESATKSSISIMQLFTLPTVKSIADYVDTQQNTEQYRHRIQSRAQRQLAALRRNRIPRVVQS